MVAFCRRRWRDKSCVRGCGQTSKCLIFVWDLDPHLTDDSMGSHEFVLEPTQTVLHSTPVFPTHTCRPCYIAASSTTHSAGDATLKYSSRFLKVSGCAFMRCITPLSPNDSRGGFKTTFRMFKKDWMTGRRVRVRSFIASAF